MLLHYIYMSRQYQNNDKLCYELQCELDEVMKTEFNIENLMNEIHDRLKQLSYIKLKAEAEDEADCIRDLISRVEIYCIVQSILKCTSCEKNDK